MATPTMREAATAPCLRRVETLAIMECRYGPQSGDAIAYDETFRIGDVDVRFVPAGHVLGSAQIVLEHRGERVVVSGDYKRRPDPTCAGFVPVPCDIFITEATFGLPVFRHPETGSEIDRLLHRLHSDPSRCVLVGAYALGKAQRIIAELRLRGHRDPIYFHGAIERLNQLYRDFGVDLGELRHTASATKAGDGRAHRDWRRLERSTTAGRGACPTRSRPWLQGGCASGNGRDSATSSFRSSFPITRTGTSSP